MILHLDGGYETVQYRQKSHLRLYYNNTSEHFPPHWHNDIEIINVLKGKLVVRCLANSYTIEYVRFSVSFGDGHCLFHHESGGTDHERTVP